MKIWDDWFPCAVMRGTRETLRTAFPTWRLALDEPILRRSMNPFTREEVDLASFDPGPNDEPTVAPPTPPLPFVCFRAGGLWFEDLGWLMALVTRTDAEWAQLEERGLVRLAIYGRASLHGAPLDVYSLPSDFRDALATLDETRRAEIERAYAESLRLPGAEERSSQTIGDLVSIARVAAKGGESLYVWANA